MGVLQFLLVLQASPRRGGEAKNTGLQDFLSLLSC